MIQATLKNWTVASLTLAIFSSSAAFSAGFEKNILWSGKYAGQGNAAVSSVDGPEALFFNPAGLAGASGNEVSFNFSPSFSKFSGPVTTANTSIDGQQTFSPIYGALVNYAVNPHLGFAVGSFVSGGARAEYQNVALPAPFQMTLNPKTDLSTIEYAAGVGYELAPGFRVGGSLRYTRVTASLVSASSSAPGGMPTVTELSLNDFTGSQFGGFRLGASYQGSNWGLGAHFRSNVDFTTSGNAAVRFQQAVPGNVISTLPDFAATASSSLPAQVSLGGHYQVSEPLRLLAEYTWTNYQKVTSLHLSGGSLTDIAMNWNNQNNLRLGASYALNRDWTIRGGYVYTSQVTATDLARPTLTPPGSANNFTAGFSTQLTSKLELSSAGEYSSVKGTGTGNAQEQTKAGDFAATGVILHTALNYKF